MQNDIKKLERIFKALANKRRLAILAHLKKKRSASVGDIAEAIILSFKATSKHLGILFAADILERDQEILTIHYRLADNLHSVVKNALNVL